MAAHWRECFKRLPAAELITGDFATIMHGTRLWQGNNCERRRAIDIPIQSEPNDMRRDKSRPVNVASNRPWYRRRLRTLVLVLAAAALAMGVARWNLQGSRSNYRTLSELLASGKNRGFDLVQEPDRPGPYEEMDAVPAAAGEEVTGSFWGNGKNRRFHIPGAPGVEYRVIGLLPQGGGEPTYIVLRRHVAP
jgi:hypothetical protein